MFFSEDSSIRKRVDMGGQSSKERDRQKLVEQMRHEQKLPDFLLYSRRVR